MRKKSVIQKGTTRKYVYMTLGLGRREQKLFPEKLQLQAAFRQVCTCVYTVKRVSKPLVKAFPIT